MKLYLVVINMMMPSTNGTINQAMRTYFIQATNIHEAIGRALVASLEQCSLKDGFSSHQVGLAEKILKTAIDGCEFDNIPEVYATASHHQVVM